MSDEMVQKLVQISQQAKALRSEIDKVFAETGQPAPAETVGKLEAMLTEGAALRKQVEAKKQAEDFQQWMEAPASEPVNAKGGRVHPSTQKSWGQLVIESPQFKAAVDAKRETMDRVNVKAIHGDADSAGGAFVIPQRSDTVLLPYRPYSILDMLNTMPTNSDTVEYVEQTTRTSNATAVPQWDTTAGDFGAKPESNLVYALRQANVKTIAHFIPASRTILRDAPQLRAMIDTDLTEMLRQELEDQVVNGDGVGANFLGILNTTGIQTRTQASTGDRGGETTDTKADAIRRAITDVRLELYEANGVVLNPGDGETIELAKDDNGMYVSIYDSATGMLWRVAVAETPAIAAGTGLVGNFYMGATLWDRQQTEIRVGEPNDYFLRNAIAILAELRAAFAVRRPLAFEKITFS